MNRSDIMRISALFEIALSLVLLIAAGFWIGTHFNIVGRHVSHGDTTEAFCTYLCIYTSSDYNWNYRRDESRKRKNEHCYSLEFWPYSPDCPHSFIY